MRRIVSGVAIVVSAALGCRSEGDAKAKARASADANANAKAEAEAKADAEALLVGARVPGVGFAAVTREREVVVGGVGRAEVARGSAVAAQTVFEAASIAKLIVATCVMQLVEERRLELDADASKYVGFALRHPTSATPITLRMLLSHRGSIRDRSDEIGAARAGHPLAAFLEGYMLEGKKPRALAYLDAAPGTTTAYSNVGASLAALAVERVAGASFADVSAQRVLAPLQMRTATWVAPPLSSPLAARPHAQRDGGFVALPSPSHALYPAVDLHASARDLARFARAMLNEGELDGVRVLTPASVRTMMTADAGDEDQALAWQLRSFWTARVAGHEGEDEGATTALFLDRAAGTGAVVLANGDAFSSDEPVREVAVQTFIQDLLGVAAVAAH